MIFFTWVVYLILLEFKKPNLHCIPNTAVIGSNLEPLSPDQGHYDVVLDTVDQVVGVWGNWVCDSDFSLAGLKYTQTWDEKHTISNIFHRNWNGFNGSLLRWQTWSALSYRVHTLRLTSKVFSGPCCNSTWITESILIGVEPLFFSLLVLFSQAPPWDVWSEILFHWVVIIWISLYFIKLRMVVGQCWRKWCV